MGRTLKIAFLRTLPVLCGYIVMGIAFGILLQSEGYNYVWAFFISLFVYAGSMQFVLVSFLGGGINILYAAVLTLSINSRHMFYGLSFVEKFRTMGKKAVYMIFSLTDETYSLLCSNKTPAGINENRLLFLIALLDHSYWITGSVVGALIGQLISFDTKGIDFAMTALFTVIMVEQWYSFKSHLPAIVGGISSITCIVLFGAGNFILPSLIVTVITLMLLRCKVEVKLEEGEGA